MTPEVVRCKSTTQSEIVESVLPKLFIFGIIIRAALILQYGYTSPYTNVSVGYDCTTGIS